MEPQTTLFESPVIKQSQAPEQIKSTREKIREIRGQYEFISPYHKQRKMLPFNIMGYSFNDEFPVEVQTVEYKGWTELKHNGNYTLFNILDMIKTGFLIPVK